jgi:hypothetical protein
MIMIMIMIMKGLWRYHAINPSQRQNPSSKSFRDGPAGIDSAG